MGSKNGREQEIILALGIPYYPINVPKLRRYLAWENFIDIFKLPFALIQAIKIFQQIKPNLVLTSGGYVTLPVVLTSWFFRVPLVIHEQTLQPGLVNRFAGCFAKKIAISFEQSENYFPRQKCVLTGNPIRPQLLQPILSSQPKEFDFQNDLPTLYVTGSYQGAQFINRFIGRHLSELLEHMNIIHQCGDNPETGDYDYLKSQNSKLKSKLKTKNQKIETNYKILKTVNVKQLQEIYQRCDLVLARAGASTIAELAALGKPAVLIPYPYAAGQEQLKIALLLKQQKAAEVCIQEEIEKDENSFVQKIVDLITNPDRLQALAANIKKFGHQDATERLAKLVLSFS